MNVVNCCTPNIYVYISRKERKKLLLFNRPALVWVIFQVLTGMLKRWVDKGLRGGQWRNCQSFVSGCVGRYAHPIVVCLQSLCWYVFHSYLVFYSALQPALRSFTSPCLDTFHSRLLMGRHFCKHSTLAAKLNHVLMYDCTSGLLFPVNSSELQHFLFILAILLCGVQTVACTSANSMAVIHAMSLN